MQYYNKDEGFFSLQSFLNRYLAGKECLVNFRNVSRARLAIQNCVKNNYDIEAFVLLNQVNNFTSSSQKIADSSQLSSELICDLNKVLIKGSSAGQFRKCRSYIATHPSSERTENLKYEDIPFHLEALFEYANDSSICKHEKSLNTYITLNLIHPFFDGNGRVSRAVLDGMLYEKEKTIINPLLYRFGTSQSNYSKMYKTNGLGEFSFHKLDYWKYATEWCNEYHLKANHYISVTRSKLNEKMPLSLINSTTNRVIQLLWEQPVVSQSYICEHLNLDSQTATSIIEDLKSKKILSAMTTSFSNRLIYISEDIFELWSSLDNAMLKQQ